MIYLLIDLICRKSPKNSEVWYMHVSKHDGTLKRTEYFETSSIQSQKFYTHIFCCRKNIHIV